MKKTSAVEHSLGQTTTVLVADEHALVRGGMKTLVAGLWGEVNFLEAQDGDSLWRIARSCPTSRLALVDLNMPGMQGGLQLLEFAREYPNIPLVAVSARSSPGIVRKTMSIRTVHALVPKSASANDFRRAIEAAAQGRKLKLAPPGRAGEHAASALTPRQEQIRRLLCECMSNKMIAGTLGIKEGTVKNHISEIFRALKATNRTQVAQMSFGAE